MDETQALKLDENFRNNLAMIRPHILSIKSVADAQLCRLWLEKLHSCSPSEQTVRNEYMSELLHQVEEGHLKYPFTDPPRKGNLQLELLAAKEKEDLNTSSWSDVTESNACHPQWESGNELYSPNTENISPKVENIHAECMQLQQYYEEQISADQTIIDRYKQALARMLADHYSEVRKEEVQDKISQIQNSYEVKINSLSSIIENLQSENEKLRQHVDHNQKLPVTETLSQYNVDSFIDEIAAMKKKLADVQNTKSALVSNHKDVVSLYQHDIGASIVHLFQRLHTTQIHNNKLEKRLEKAFEKLNSLEMQHKTTEMDLRSNDLETKLNMAFQKLEDLTLKYAKEKVEGTASDEMRIGMLEMVNAEKISLVKQNIAKLKMMMSLKEKEVIELEDLLKVQCFEMQDEVRRIKEKFKITSDYNERKLKAKVNELQKTLEKNTRSKAKLIKNYDSKLNRLEKERNIVIKGLQLQLQTQKAEITAELTQSKQKEIELLMANLEERYKVLLMESERKFIRKQEEDKQKILKLEMELATVRTN